MNINKNIQKGYVEEPEDKVIRKQSRSGKEEGEGEGGRR